MSNLVLQADRREYTRRDLEAGGGAAESLWGKIDPKSFGDKAAMMADEDKRKRELKRQERLEKRRKVDDRSSKKEYIFIKINA
jgi:pre-mRNA-splicing helicase BRR2